MLKFVSVLFAGLMFCFYPLSAMGEDGKSSSANATASLEIINPILISKVDDMNFGKILNGFTGSVLLTTSGGRSAVGANVVGTTGWSPAKFDVRGTNDYEYYIALPSNIVLKNGDNEIRVENLVAKPSTSSNDALVGVVKSDSYFTVGGRLVINSSTLPAGIYTSSFDVSIGYN
jgi:hypothetical protein